MVDKAILTPIIRTKLHRPPVAPDILPRARLLEQLNEGRQRPLSLICAPAGYGKSTLASRWLEACDCPSAWLSLDESENDLRMFLNYLLSAIKTMFPDAVPNTQALVNASTLPPLPVLAGSLVNELDLIKQDFILALDDYQYIHERAVHDLFTELLRHPPQNMHLALLTRRDPPLPISTLRARGQVAEVRAQDLRFTPAETAAYLEKLLGERIDESTAAAWAEKTEGWVSGLRLAAISMRHRGDVKSMLPEQQGGAQYVMEYLFIEVLADQPPRVRDYLLSTSILNRFCAPLCDTLRGPDVELGPDEIDSWKFIALLKQENMFVISLDAESRWFRYHHLFQDLLQSQLKRSCGSEEIAKLHSRASKWFAESGLIDEAIQHALIAGDMISAAQLVEQNRQAVLNADRWYVLEKWLGRLPEEVRHERPEILLAMAWIAYHKFLVAEIPPLLERIEAVIDYDNVSPTVLGELNLFKSYLFYLQGQGELSLELAQKALDQLPTECKLGRADAEIYLGLACQMMGQKDTAVGTLNKKLRSQPRQAGPLLTRLHATSPFVHLIAGELREADQAAMQLENAAKKSRLDYAGLWGSFIRGCCAFQANDLEAAGRHLGHVATNRYIHHTRAAINGMAGLALTHQAMQWADRADEAIRELLAFSQETSAPENLVIAGSCMARISLLRGDLEPAVRWLQRFDETPNPPSMLFFLEIPSITQNRVLIATGSDAGLRDAESRLAGLWEATQAVHNIFQMIGIGVLRSLALLKMARVDEALAVLDHVVTLATPGGWIRPFVEAGPPMADLLKRLIKQNVSVEYVGKILAAFKDHEQVAVPEASDAQAGPAPSLGPPSPRQPVSPSPPPQPLDEPLTNRELDVLELLAQRLQNKEIAEKLCISPETVKAHLKKIFQKLMVSTRRQAITRAKALGIL